MSKVKTEPLFGYRFAPIVLKKTTTDRLMIAAAARPAVGFQSGKPAKEPGFMLDNRLYSVR
jgi:hypothetical protein